MDIKKKVERCRETQVGRIVIHLEDKEKRIYPEDLDKYLQEGWKQGTKESHNKNNGASRKGKPSPMKGVKGVFKRNSTTWEKGRIPWNKGKKGVQTSWCKGLTKEDPKMQNRVRALQASWDSAPESRRQAQSERGKLLRGRKKDPEQLEQYLEKCYTTRAKHNTFSSSVPEMDYKKYLVEGYGENNVLTQYRKDPRYPFNCDFYIKSEDLFIEINLHWTHGFRPYNPEDSECQNQLLEWQEKAKTSQFYKNAIETWTVRDVKKLQVARENNLNFLFVYPKGLEIKE